MDGKNIIFGRLVDGMDALDQMEKFEADKNGQPVEAICIETVHILADSCQQVIVGSIGEQSDAVDTQQVDIVDGEKRKQSMHSLEPHHEVFSF